MQKYIEYVNRFHEGNEIEIDFIQNQLKKYLEKNQENQTEIEEILDYLYSKKPNISKVGYKTILEKTKKWHKSLSKLESKDQEIAGVDYEVVKDFGDGYKFVKLLSQSAYNREGKLMSHCVASYYGRNVAIYSLRDSKNQPHCTIEENNQVKGKGNQTVDNKYFGYCIKFLEEIGFSIGENEMKNIGFHKLETIDENLQVEEKYLYDGKYISEKNIDKIKDKDGEQYYGFGLLNIKDLVIFNGDLKFSINLDIKNTVDYLIKSCKGIFDNIKSNNSNEKISNKKDSAQIGSSGDYAQIGSSGNYAKIGSSGNSAQIGSSGYSAKIGSSGNYAQIGSSGNYAKIGSSGNYAQIGSSGDSAQIGSSGYSAKIGSSGDSAKIGSSGNSAQIGSSGYSAQIGSSGDSAQIGSSGHYAKISSEGENAVIAGIGYNNKIKAKKGSWITLAEYDNKGICICVKSQQIDGEILKEDTFYILENGEFQEFNS